MSALCALRWGAARIASGGAILLAILLPCDRLTTALAAERPPKVRAPVDLGRELFLRVWQPNDNRAQGGDGLGPVFNARSCAECHNQGGVGGGGSAEANVNVLSPSGLWTQPKLKSMHPGLANNRRVVLHLSGVNREYDKWRSQRRFAQLRARRADPLEEPVAQPAEDAFVAALSQAANEPAVMPVSMQIQMGFARQAKALEALQSGGVFDPTQFSVEMPPAADPTPRFRPRRAAPAAEAHHEPVTTTPGLVVSERNTTSLFGLGLVDGIPDSLIEAVALEERRDTPKTAGRIARLGGNRIGRFGWHGQHARLADFTLTACAVEIGLELPGHPQAGDPRKPEYRSPGFDMDAQDCAALVAYVAQLPAPTIADFGMVRSEKQKLVREGHTLFAKIGCADCHRETMGDAVGLYSDLLLHGMGPELRAGAYGAFAPQGTPARDASKEAASARAPVVDFSRTTEEDELWRTPPLWGVASSAPYLHDGRAATLLDAVELHGGQGLRSAQLFSSLPAGEQNAVLTFMSSLIAPPSAEPFAQPGFGHGWGAVNRSMQSLVNQRGMQKSTPPADLASRRAQRAK